MRESRPSGSVEGVMGNHDSYSDPGPLRLPIALWPCQTASEWFAMAIPPR